MPNQTLLEKQKPVAFENSEFEIRKKNQNMQLSTVSYYQDSDHEL